MTKLRRCPFCGGEVAAVVRLGEIGENYVHPEYFDVVCDAQNGGCGAAVGGEYPTEEEAISAWNKRAEEMNDYERMSDKERFYALRRRVFEAIDRIRAEGESGKSYEGLFEILYDFEECHGAEIMKDEPQEVRINLHCYLLGPYRHYSWKGKTLAEALDQAEAQINVWIAEALDDLD